jgi:hypothetical protein
MIAWVMAEMRKGYDETAVRKHHLVMVLGHRSLQLLDCVCMLASMKAGSAEGMLIRNIFE